MTQKQVLEGNIAALKLVLQNTSGKYTSKEIEQIKQFNGWGYSKAVLMDPDVDSDWDTTSEADKKLRSVVKELHQMLSDELRGKDYKVAIESIKGAVLTSFYTPAVVPQVFYEVLNKRTTCESLYDPCVGSGVFITEAIRRLSLQNGVAVVEKDMLTAKVIDAICSSLPITAQVYHKGFEEIGNEDDGSYDLICSNIPFGAISIYDPTIEDKDIKKKIHNYFFAKGLQKLRDGGILAYVVSSAFLDTITNKAAREYVFSRADLISVVVLPDNLFKESANTEAPSHFIVVRKNSSKTELSGDECELVHSAYTQTEKGPVAENAYIHIYRDGITIGETKVGKNQYGKPSLEVWWDKPIEGIAEPFREILERDFFRRYKYDVVIPEPTEAEYEQELEDEIQANMKDGCLGKEEDDPADAVWLDPEFGPHITYQKDTDEAPTEQPVKELKGKDKKVMDAFIEISAIFNQLEENT